MILFHNDYSEGCHERILHQMVATNMEQTDGYGVDPYCFRAADRIRSLCADESLAVHFLVGGTQANLTVIDAALRPHQGALCAESGHIHVHETGAVEATGHKVLALVSADGKITAEQVEQAVHEHRSSDSFEHAVQPKLVYISNPTELGTIYHLAELEALSEVCKKNGLYLFMDGARLGYGLTAAGNDVALPDLARLCDVFYIGGTKAGALFGEAVVIRNPAIAEDFRYLIKQHGAMLAKGRLLGIQFDALLQDDLYFKICANANRQAEQIRTVLENAGCSFLVPGVTNQIFPILSDRMLNQLEKEFQFTDMGRLDETHRAIRICTSWATKQENVEALCTRIRELSGT